MHPQRIHPLKVQSTLSMGAGGILDVGAGCILRQGEKFVFDLFGRDLPLYYKKAP